MSKEIKTFNNLKIAYYCGKLKVKSIHKFKRLSNKNEQQYQMLVNSLIFPYSGRSNIWINDEKFQAEPGKLIYIPQGHKIKFEVLDNSDFIHYNIYLNDTDTEIFIKDIDDYKYYAQQLDQLLKLSKTNINELKEFYYREKYISMIMKKLFKLDDPHEIENFRLIEKVEVFLNKNYFNNISISEVAEELKISTTSISYIYKKYRNESIKSRIIDLRLKKAIELITQYNYSIKDVANEVGYNDPLYFSRLFKLKLGISPNDLKTKI